MLRHLVFTFVCCAALILVGCEKKCAVPQGTYKTTYSVLEGDCPPEVVASFEGHEETIEVTDAECRDFVTSVDGKTEGGCKMTMEVSAEARATGVDNGQAVLTIKCDPPEEFVCKHRFGVEYKRVP